MTTSDREIESAFLTAMTTLPRLDEFRRTGNYGEQLISASSAFRGLLETYAPPGLEEAMPALKGSLAAHAFSAAMSLERFSEALQWAEYEVAAGMDDKKPSFTFARGLNNRGLAKQELGQLVDAQKDYLEGLRIVEEMMNQASGDSAACNLRGVISNNLAQLRLARGEVDRVDDLLVSSATAPDSIWRNEEEQSAFRFNNLGFAALHHKRFDEAISLFKRGLKEAEDASNLHMVGIFRCNIGSVYLEREDYVLAKDYLREACAAHETSNSKGPLAIDFYQLGLTHRGLEERAEATTAIRLAWDNVRQAAPHSIQALRILRDLGLQRLVTGDKKRARAAFLRGIELYEEMRPNVGENEEQHEGSLKSLRLLIEMMLYLSLDDSWTDEAADFVERAKGRIWYEHLYRLRILEQDGPAKGDLRQQLHKLQTEETRGLSILSSESTVTKVGEAANARLQVEAWEAKALGNDSTLHRDRSKGFAADVLKDLSNHNTLVLDYFVGPNATFVTYCYNGSLGSCRLDVAETELTLLVKDSCFELLASKSRLGPRYNRSAQLSRLLLEKINIDFGNIRLVHILPDGPLWYFPFDAMLVPTTTNEVRMFLDVAPVTIAPNAIILTELRRREGLLRPRHEWRFLGVGAPDLGPEMAPIPGTKEQLSILESELEISSPCILSGREATPRALLEGLKGATHVHIASHARGDTGDKDPGVFLSDGKGGWELLRPKDFSSLSLAADLVQLVCCSTSLGRASSGEGLMSLARAFILAGARCVIASLWPITDRHAASLVRSFYSHLLTGESVARALWTAKRELRDSQGTIRTWSALQVLGDADSHESRMSTIPEAQL